MVICRLAGDPALGTVIGASYMPDGRRTGPQLRAAPIRRVPRTPFGMPDSTSRAWTPN